MISEMGHLTVSNAAFNTHINSSVTFHTYLLTHAQSADAKHISLAVFPFKLFSPAIYYAADNSREHKLMQKNAQTVKEKKKRNGSG